MLFPHLLMVAPRLHKNEQAYRTIGEARALFHQVGDQRMEANCLMSLGYLTRKGAPLEAKQRFLDAARIYEELKMLKFRDNALAEGNKLPAQD